MNIVDRASLAATLDVVNEALFFGRELSQAARQKAAAWIAGRQGGPGSYTGLFAPTARDFEDGMRLFTGERLATRAGMAHVLGEEACRALILLGASRGTVRDALAAAAVEMTRKLRRGRERKAGTYCCGKCTAALWRHLAAGGFADADPERFLAAGLKTLRAHRLGGGKWRRFPLWYTLLALSEMDLPGAKVEMRYAAPACERLRKRSAEDDKFARRRRALAERVLGKA